MYLPLVKLGSSVIVSDPNYCNDPTEVVINDVKPGYYFFAYERDKKNPSIIRSFNLINHQYTYFEPFRPYRKKIYVDSGIGIFCTSSIEKTSFIGKIYDSIKETVFDDGPVNWKEALEESPDKYGHIFGTKGIAVKNFFNDGFAELKVSVRDNKVIGFSFDFTKLDFD